MARYISVRATQALWIGRPAAQVRGGGGSTTHQLASRGPIRVDGFICRRPQRSAAPRLRLAARAPLLIERSPSPRSFAWCSVSVGWLEGRSLLVAAPQPNTIRAPGLFVWCCHLVRVMDSVHGAPRACFGGRRPIYGPPALL